MYIWKLPKLRLSCLVRALCFVPGRMIFDICHIKCSVTYVLHFMGTRNWKSKFLPFNFERTPALLHKIFLAHVADELCRRGHFYRDCVQYFISADSKKFVGRSSSSVSSSNVGLSFKIPAIPPRQYNLVSTCARTCNTISYSVLVIKVLLGMCVI